MLMRKNVNNDVSKDSPIHVCPTDKKTVVVFLTAGQRFQAFQYGPGKCYKTVDVNISRRNPIGNRTISVFNQWTKTLYQNNFNYYISKLVHALRLVNLVGRNLLYGPLKFKAVFVAKMFRDLSPSVLNGLAIKS